MVQTRFRFVITATLLAAFLIGHGPNVQGQITVTGAVNQPYNGTDDPWETSALRIGSDGVDGTMQILGGSTVDNSGDGEVGFNNGHGDVLVSGSNSAWNNTGLLEVLTVDSRVQISNGGVVTGGFGSRIQNGELLIVDGGLLDTFNVVTAAFSGDALIAVSGQGSRLEGTSILAGSTTGTANIRVNDGGVIDIQPLHSAATPSVELNSPTSTLEVQGTGSLLNIENGIAAFEDGIATISDGGKLMAGSLVISDPLGTSASASPRLNITGTGSEAIVSAAEIARQGQLTVADGAFFSANVFIMHEDGEVVLDNATMSISRIESNDNGRGRFVLSDGRLEGVGTIRRSLTMDQKGGVFAPEGDTVISFSDYFLDSGTIEMDIFGTDHTDNDLLRLQSSDFDLVGADGIENANLEVLLHFAPSIGDSFTIVESSSNSSDVNGMFADGLQTFATFDGFVYGFDIAYFGEDFGDPEGIQLTVSSISVAVPEPSTATVLLLLAAPLLTRRKRQA